MRTMRHWVVRIVGRRVPLRTRSPVDPLDLLVQAGAASGQEIAEGIDLFIATRGFIAFDEIERLWQCLDDLADEERAKAGRLVLIAVVESPNCCEERCPGCGLWGYSVRGRSGDYDHAGCGTVWL